MLAIGLPAELILLRAVAVPTDVKEILEHADFETDSRVAALVAEANEYLQRVADRLRATGLEVATAVCYDPAADAIVDYADENRIQRIVMATHGYSGISRWMHGSVAERVIQSAKTPILLVRAHAEDEAVSYKPLSCQRILVPLDGSQLAEQALPPALTVAKALSAELVLFRVPSVFASLSLAGEGYMPLEGVIEAAHQDAQSYLEQVAHDLKGQGFRVSIALQIGGVANAIIDYAETYQIDLIAMSTHGRTGLARWALGSIADRVLRAGKLPILLVRAQ
jgi:nucleotide-binding universal stress UspA family protein